MAETTSGASWSDPSRDPLEDLLRAKELAEEKYEQGLSPEYDPISPGLFRRLFGRLQWWLATPFRAYDEAHDMDVDAPSSLPEMVCVIDEVDLNKDVVVPPIRYDLGIAGADPRADAREWFRRGRLVWFANPAPVSCAFCPEPGTEEIFLGWASATDGHPIAHFARVCINHVGHSRFTRSDRPVDEL